MVVRLVDVQPPEPPNEALALAPPLPSVSQEVVAFARALTLPGADYLARLAENVGDPEERELRRALNAIAGRVGSDLQEIARLTNVSSGSVARNAFFLEQIAGDASEQADLMEGSVARLDEMVENMRNVVDGARRSLEIATRTGQTSTATAAIARDSLGELEAAAATFDKFDQMIADLWNRVEGIGGAIEAIGDISAQSHLLSINASIEAAHAGEWGRTFTVIAHEIKNLAESTKSFTAEIEELLQTVRSQVENLREVSNETRQTTVRVRDSSTKVEEALTAMGEGASKTRDQISEIAAAAAQQTQGLDTLVDDVRDVAGAASSTLRTIAQARKLKIGDLNSQLHAVIGRYRIGGFVDRSYEVGERAAAEIEAVLERGVERGEFLMSDLIDPVYRELRDEDVKGLARLFDVRHAGGSFDPPKFGTTYDAKVDRELCEIVDRYTDQHPEFSALCVMDLNAFHIAHYRLLRAPITGNPVVDRANNRVKRIFESHTAIRCARIGLDGAEQIPSRSGRRVFETAGISLARRPGPRPYMVQSYARDTGEVFNDLSIALYVKGQHYGALSIAYPAETV
jgi:methyl-accepting chemotaxis protein